MKKFKYLAVGFLAISLAACGGKDSEKSADEANDTVDTTVNETSQNVQQTTGEEGGEVDEANAGTNSTPQVDAEPEEVVTVKGMHSGSFNDVFKNKVQLAEEDFVITTVPGKKDQFKIELKAELESDIELDSDSTPIFGIILNGYDKVPGKSPYTAINYKPLKPYVEIPELEKAIKNGDSECTFEYIIEGTTEEDLQDAKYITLKPSIKSKK